MAQEPRDDVQELLAAMAESDFPELTEVKPEILRERRQQFIAGVESPFEVGSIEDRMIPGPSGEIPIKVYTPTGTGPHPIIVFFHGGGFIYGSPDTYDGPCRYLTRDAEAIVVSVDYRLAPEHPFPAAVEDAYAATEWVAKNADTLNGDASTLAVVGDSAGGTLAGVVSLAARDRDGPDITHQVLIYPAVDQSPIEEQREKYPSLIENAEGYFLETEALSYLRENYLRSWVNEANPYASPIRAGTHANLPAATIVTCGFDPLRDQGIAYADALEEAGTSVTRRHFDDLIHGIFNMGVAPFNVESGLEVIDTITNDLQSALH